MSSSESSDSESDFNTSKESVFSEADLSQDEGIREDDAAKATVVEDDESADSPG